jgi:hypothetical protein
MALGERWSAHTGRWKALPGAGEPSRALESPLPGAVAPSGSLFTLTLTLSSFSHSLLSEEDFMGRCHA